MHWKVPIRLLLASPAGRVSLLGEALPRGRPSGVASLDIVQPFTSPQGRDAKQPCGVASLGRDVVQPEGCAPPGQSPGGGLGFPSAEPPRPRNFALPRQRGGPGSRFWAGPGCWAPQIGGRGFTSTPA
jgi:hypothetical protein